MNESTSAPFRAALNDIIELSRAVGRPEADLVILGEGNTSVGVDEESFLVKASGTQLGTASKDSFVLVSRKAVLDMLEKEHLSDDEVKRGLESAVLDAPDGRPSSGARPSVETLIHAYLQSLPGVRYVAHTHPTSLNAILCCDRAEELLSGRLFPDEIVCCGGEHVFVPYTDPGAALAREVRSRCERYIAANGQLPRSILMKNHGLIVLGSTIKTVVNACAMWVKVARILTGAALLGNPSFFTKEQVERITTRPDEKYRQQLLERGASR